MTRDYVLKHSDIFMGKVITQSYGATGISGLGEWGEFSSDQLNGKYFVVGTRNPNIEELYNFRKLLNLKEVPKRFNVSMGIYKNITLFDGPSLHIGLSAGPAGTTRSYSILPDGSPQYSGYSSSAGLNGQRLFTGSASYTFIYDLKRKN